MHGFHVDDPTKYSREWFSWANADVLQVVLDYLSIPLMSDRSTDSSKESQIYF